MGKLCRHSQKLKEDTNSNKVWRTIKALDTGIKVENRNEEMVVEGKAITSDKRKAESFIQMYHRINRINASKEDRNKTKSINLRVKQYKEGGEENEPFQEQELETAIKQMAEKKKGGFDRIEPAMIKHCSPGGKRWLLEIINQSWQEGNVTGRWKKAIIIPIPKNGKDPSKCDSYRPVSLTPVVVKVMKRMVTNRLNYWMEDTSNK